MLEPAFPIGRWPGVERMPGTLPILPTLTWSKGVLWKKAYIGSIRLDRRELFPSPERRGPVTTVTTARRGLASLGMRNGPGGAERLALPDAELSESGQGIQALRLADAPGEEGVAVCPDSV
jgi:hypothetical protein